MNSKLIKVLTLVLFFGMISAYVIYRSGTGSEEVQVQTSPNGSSLSNGKKDTLALQKHNDSIAKRVLDSIKITNEDIHMSSSKSMIIVEPKDLKLDSTVRKPKK